MIALLVIDSGGVGAAPDAAAFGDVGADTIGHALAAHPVPLPHLSRLGLSRLVQVPGPEVSLGGAVAAVHPRAAGKDTLAGHWEMMGVIVERPFRTYPDGFPPDVVDRLEAAFGRPILGNRAASGTAIIAELGAEHMATGRPIVYTSADSVLQIACHEEVVPLETLYEWCQKARAIMTGPHLVGRIIARPFVGEPGHFVRTPHRHDYAVAPPDGIFTEQLKDGGVTLEAVGKIWDIFSGRGFTRPHPTTSNRDGLEQTVQLMAAARGTRTLVFTNLVDFDSQYGHRRDPGGYARALAELDAFVPRLLGTLGPDDQLWITADHGCDPTAPGSDHTRENVPLLIGGPAVKVQVLPDRKTLADIGQSLGEAFAVPLPAVGISFWKDVAP
jgi:phosphopentomutase